LAGDKGNLMTTNVTKAKIRILRRPEVNSVERAKKVEALVTKSTEERLKRPLTTIRTIEQMMAEESPEQPQDGADEIPP
jgi:hypothetical protein